MRPDDRSRRCGAIGRRARGLALVLAVLGFALLFQGSRGLWERDEGRYTDVAVQMLRNKDFLIPAFNDEFPHLTKPPLTYWALAGGLAALGRNEWGARLPNALAFAATLFVLYGLARRITPDRAWLPPVIYATSLLPFTAANIVTTDTLLTLWEALAALGFVEWWCREDGFWRKASSFLMWLSFGLAFLTKGPPGLLPLAAFLVFAGIVRGRKGLTGLLQPAGLLAFALVGLGWYAAVAAARPGVLSYWLRDEVVARVASDVHHRNPQWYKPFIIYLPVLGFGCFPWVLPLARGARRVSRLRSRAAWSRKLREDPWAVFLGLWFLLPLGVFFASSSRLPLYVLPLAPPLALAVGRWVVLPLRRQVELPLLAAWIVVLLAGKYAGSKVPYAMDSRALSRAVAAAVQPLPKEVLFADTEPSWGLSLYLGCEVERVFTGPAAPKGEVDPGEPLVEELRDAEPGTLLLVARKKEAGLREACRRLGREVRPAGGHSTWSFLSVTVGKAAPTPEGHP